MGFIRGLLVVVISVLLFLSILSMTLFGVLSSSLSYENVKENSASLIKDSLEDGFNLSRAVGNVIPLMQKYCKNNSVSDYVFSSEGYTFDIPCETVLQGKDKIIEEGLSDLVYKTYYKQYDCSFIECLKKSPFDEVESTFVEILVSERAYDYWNNKFYFFLGAVFILSLGLFLFVEKKSNSFILLGGMLVISSLIFIKIDSALSFFSNKIFLNLAKVFFSESFSISVRILISGIAMFIFGLILKIFKIGFKLQNFISKLKKSENKFVPKQEFKKQIQKRSQFRKSKKSK